jgi:hypothetical protein
MYIIAWRSEVACTYLLTTNARQILHYTPETDGDRKDLMQALSTSEKILMEVNEAAREVENKVKFNEIISKVDLRFEDNVRSFEFNNMLKI